jgi:hypothetical protein
MKKLRDHKECLARLKALHSNDNLTPEQKAQIEIAIDRVKELGRKKNPSRAEVFACVKEVALRLIRIIPNNTNSVL